MSSIETDEHGLLVKCSQCGQRNRMRWEGLGQTFRCGKCQTELGPPRVPIDVRNDRIFDALISRSPLPVLVDFWAPWCGPCKMAAPEFNKVAAEVPGRWLVLKVNTEESPVLASRFRVTSIPTMITFRGGSEIARLIGAMPAARIRQFIEQAEVQRK